VASALGSLAEELGALVRASHDEHASSARPEVLRASHPRGGTRRSRHSAEERVSAGWVIRGRRETRVALVSATRAVASVAGRGPRTPSRSKSWRPKPKQLRRARLKKTDGQFVDWTLAARDGTCRASGCRRARFFRESFADLLQIRPRGQDRLRAPVTDPQLSTWRTSRTRRRPP
jgi:hypothetical protein